VELVGWLVACLLVWMVFVLNFVSDFLASRSLIYCFVYIPLVRLTLSEVDFLCTLFSELAILPFSGHWLSLYQQICLLFISVLVVSV
jgi:hypothetical protein